MRISDTLMMHVAVAQELGSSSKGYINIHLLLSTRQSALGQDTEPQDIAPQPLGITRANPMPTQTCIVGWGPVCQQGFMTQLHRGESLLSNLIQGALFPILPILPNSYAKLL